MWGQNNHGGVEPVDTFHQEQCPLSRTRIRQRGCMNSGNVAVPDSLERRLINSFNTFLTVIRIKLGILEVRNSGDFLPNEGNVLSSLSKICCMNFVLSNTQGRTWWSKINFETEAENPHLVLGLVLTERSAATTPSMACPGPPNISIFQ